MHYFQGEEKSQPNKKQKAAAGKGRGKQKWEGMELKNKLLLHFNLILFSQKIRLTHEVQQRMNPIRLMISVNSIIKYKYNNQ